LRDVSLNPPTFEDVSDARAPSSRRAAAAFPPDFGPARRDRERPALARYLRAPRLGVAALAAIAGLALIGVPMNALFLQDGRHPAPLFGARALKPEPLDTAEKTAPAPHTARETETAKIDPSPRARAAKPELRADAAALTAEILKSEPPATAAKKRDAVAPRDPISALIGARVQAAAPPKPPRPAAAIPAAPRLATAAPAPVAPTPAAAPPPAATGPDQGVLSAQRALQRLGYVVKPDGQMSPALRKTIEKFEHDNGLPPTGQLDPKVVKLLAARTAAQR
jgi:hypothetical protein